MLQPMTNLTSPVAVDGHPRSQARHAICSRHETMFRYRRRSGEIEAVRWNGANRDEVRALSGELPEMAGRLLFTSDGAVIVPTRDGDRIASRWDWLIRDADGTVYPITHEAFAATYEPTSHGSRPEERATTW
jgi:hypothetical protein